MTCIVGVARGGLVWMGSDTRVSDDVADEVHMFGPKAWRTSLGVLVGVSGELNALQRLRYRCTLPGIPIGIGCADDAYGWAVREIVPRFIDALDGAGEESMILIGVSGHLFALDPDMAVVNVGPEYAIGSGAKAAMGALFATKKRSPEKRVMVALEAAASCCASCGAPFDVIRS